MSPGHSDKAAHGVLRIDKKWTHFTNMTCSLLIDILPASSCSGSMSHGVGFRIGPKPRPMESRKLG